MSFENDFSEAGHHSSSGPLERTALRSDDSGEKSLLELIEERSAARQRDGDSDNRDGLFANGTEDIDDECRPELDHKMIRLGGNGF
jgi:hypothetical protein